MPQDASCTNFPRVATAGTAEPEDNEVINIQFVPLKKAVAMVLGGRIQDAETIAGVLWLDQQSRRTLRK